MSTAVKRACDACHRRKVKCDGVNPCRNCQTASLNCSYNAIPQKKGPKGSRAKVISELRETQRATSLSAKVHARMNSPHTPQGPPSLQANFGILAPDFVKETMDFFFSHMYTIMPILSRQRLEHQIQFLEQDMSTYCMIASLGAFMLLQPGFQVPGGDPQFNVPGAFITASKLLMEEAIRVRKVLDHNEASNLNNLCTSYFLYCCYDAENDDDRAWFYLREATTMAHTMGLTKEDQYMHFDQVESSRFRRVYWQLFVAERAHTLRHGRPMSLPLINSTSINDDPTDPQMHQINNHILLANVFKYFDDTFMLLWSKARIDINPQHLALMRRRLAEIQLPFGADEINKNLNWLRGMAWHLGRQPGMSPGSDDMTYPSPPGMSDDMTTMIVSQLYPQGTALLGGVPMAAKLMDLTCELADILRMMPNPGDPFSAVSPQQLLNALIHVVAVIQTGEYQLLPLLLLKVNETLPHLANPNLQRAPDNLSHINNFDLFEGFGNAGMAQVPVLTDYKPEPQFKPEPFAPVSVHRADEMINDDGSPNTLTNSEMHTPFTMSASSPTIMSPNNVDYPQHMADYNSIPDMMNTMGASQHQGLSQQQLSHHQQHPGFQQQGLQQQGLQAQQTFGQHAHAMHDQMQNSMHTQLGQQMSQQGMAGINHQQQNSNHGQGFNLNGGMAQNLMSNILHRTSPPRANSYTAMQQQPQQQQQPPQFGLQRTASDHMSMSTLGMNSMGSGMEF
ncbi:hypothetical protein G7054_g8480 [Neopestalotiopsis clavispora]|nr:hypothetical protein E8E14_006614 [Neopestalotiopsis sp. 37M]KAF7531886.1 hypothetical protein G7054_g8480 [Neopestalotiopsis clavispora]